jgi:acetyltransferase EpsM
MTDRLIIIGAGGHAKVLCDAVMSTDKYEIMGFCDDNYPIGTKVNGFEIIGKTIMNTSKLPINCHFIIAIGNIEVRKKLFNYYLLKKIPSALIIHSSAIIGSNVKIGKGTVVLPHAIINSGTDVGQNCLIDSGVIIDHDCKIGNNSHLKIGTLVGNNSIILEEYVSSIGEIIPSFSKIH